jgi:hypothetical protein
VTDVSDGVIAHKELFTRVAEQLSRTPSTTDHLMLTKWRVLSICQYLLGGQEEVGEACRAALEVFGAHGAGAVCDRGIKAANAVLKCGDGATATVLPSISNEKRAAVSAQLDRLAVPEGAAIARALRALPSVSERMSAAVRGITLPGMKHRFDLVTAILRDSGRMEQERRRAAAVVLHVDDVLGVVPDRLDVIRLLDGDYLLRVALEQLCGARDASMLHWSEKIASLWDDLPFLQGVNLQRDDGPISVTWLERVTSYVSYSHVLSSEKAPLLLLQPSIICSPLHTIVTLIALLALDAVTSSKRKIDALVIGRKYAFDRHVALYEGVTTDERIQGWLQLRFRNGHAYANPTLADQMVTTKNDRALTDARGFQAGAPGRDPLRRFFNWNSPIGPASITSHIVLVTSNRRALEILEHVRSNGVCILDHGLTQFLGLKPDHKEARGTVLLVVPSLSVARILAETGTPIQSVLVDGYARFHSGRHELPFLINRQASPPVINWSVAGYFPPKTPSWLPPHRRLEVSSDDLADILELDDASTDIAHASLWEAATGITVQARIAPAPPAEAAVVHAIDTYLDAVRSSQALPEYWRYHLLSLARTLRTLIAATPSEWSAIRQFASAWSSSIDEKWSSLRSSALTALSDLRSAEKDVLGRIEDVPDVVNSGAAAVVAFLSEPAHAEGHWRFVCERPEQAKIAASALRTLNVKGVEPVLLRDLAVCSACLVTGWISSSFARRLWAHTPRTIIALTDENDRRRWERAAEEQRRPGKESLLGAVGGTRPLPSDSGSPSTTLESHRADDDVEVGSGTDERVPCVFLWVTGGSEIKVLEPDARVVVEEGDIIRERFAARLRPDDRVILGIGTGRWSPADEFTGAVVDAVETSHPQLVGTAKEWRLALRRLVEMQRLSTQQLQRRLAAVGLGREDQTVEGWLNVDRASPIAPRGARKELALLWPLVEQYTKHSLVDVAEACVRLRALRTAAGRALLQLWKGRAVELGVSETWLDEFVDRLRLEVQVCELEAITFGEVPRPMLGWWIPATQAETFGSESAVPLAIDADEGDDAGTG